MRCPGAANDHPARVRSEPARRYHSVAVSRDLALPAVNYQLFYKLFLRHIPPELAHAFASGPLGSAGRIPAVRRLVRRFMGPSDPILTVNVFGRTLSSPLGVAAGMDKNAKWFEGLGMIGFGFVEVGTATGLPQRGSRGRRIERFFEDRAMLNWMGFPNHGAERIASRLRRKRSEKIGIGVNIGKSKVVPLAEAGDDYRRSVRELAHLADYLVLNVSSPNTPGLRDLQATELLGDLISDVQTELASRGVDVPVLVKVGPDLSLEEINAIADLALSRGLAGIIATNTTVDRAYFESRFLKHDQPAGLSGEPLKARALEVLRQLRARVGDQLVLIAVGGIGTPEDAWQRILAGATLVQAHTGFVYGGPAWPRRMNRDLARLVRNAGSASVQDLVGAGVAQGPPVAKPTAHGATEIHARPAALTRASTLGS